jgi:hypothetical protein
MRRFPLAEVEIIGFNGIPTKACGQSIPVGKHKSLNLFFNLPINEKIVEPKPSISEREFYALHEEGRVTLLPERVPAKLGATVFYVTRMFLKAVDNDSPYTLIKEFKWQKLQEHGIQDDTWAAYESKAAIDTVLNDCAQRLIKKASGLLKDFLTGNNPNKREEAEHIADMALFAARDPALRSRSYLPYGLSVKLSENSERLDGLYEYFVRRDFPAWTWDSFLTRLQRFKDSLQERIVTPLPDNPIQTPEMPEIAKETERTSNKIRKDIDVISSITDKDERLMKSREAAQQSRNLYQPEHDEVIALLNSQARGAWLPLENAKALSLAACEESAYFDHRVVLRASEGNRKDQLNLTRLAELIYDPESELEAGPLAEAIMSGR